MTFYSLKRDSLPPNGGSLPWELPRPPIFEIMSTNQEAITGRDEQQLLGNNIP